MTKVKICGITNIEDALWACELGVWAIGFVFYPKSKRFITAQSAKNISLAVKKYDVKTIGVFVNSDIDFINKTSSDALLDYVQMHGFEPSWLCDKLNRPFIKNIRKIEEIEKYKNASYFLVDANDKKDWGGTGKLANWEFATEIKKKNLPLILSGGLSENNISEAICKVNPDIVDISSGVEKFPGVKNHKLMKDFFDKIKNIGG